ncbi:MAG TPA: hypothetical protein VFX70_00680 [Mycobacteriales bacterium]|nr:hypothetical protein [Mycobacteriales bacterium]
MTRPSPHPHPAPAGPTVEDMAAFGRWVLTMHQPQPAEYGYRPHWCSCGSALVLCPYRSAATRYLNPPGS